MKTHSFRIALALAAMQAVLAAPPARADDGSHSQLTDRSAIPAATTAYAFLTSRTLKTGSNLILGQHLGGPGDLAQTTIPHPTGWKDGEDEFDMQNYRIDRSPQGTALTAFPRMVGMRYDAYLTDGTYTLDAAHVAQINQKVLDIYGAYHPMVALTATPLNPWDPSAGRSPTTNPLIHEGSLLDLLHANRDPNKPNKPATRFWNDIDTIVAGLKQLQAAGVPVVFRPFAEVNTNKYYFVGKNSSDFIALWDDVTQYYHDNGVHNVIYCWEAWAWGRNAGATPPENVIAPWFPDQNVDVVGGAFYFGTNQQDYFTLNFSGQPHGTIDQQVFDDLMHLATSSGKPFGAAQWAVDSDATGDDMNTLTFAQTIDRQRKAGADYQHLSFVYYWSGFEEVEKQRNAAAFVNDPSVATISGADVLTTEDGWLLGAGSPAVVKASSPGNAITGFSGSMTGNPNCTNCQYRSILSFNLSALPPHATIDDWGGTLMTTAQAIAGTSPYNVAGQASCIDAAVVAGKTTHFGNGYALGTDDFASAVDKPATCFGAMSNPTSTANPHPSAANASFGHVPAAYLDPRNDTQLRTYFKVAPAGTGGGAITWYPVPHPGLPADVSKGAGDDTGPQLIFSYTLPN